MSAQGEVACPGQSVESHQILEGAGLRSLGDAAAQAVGVDVDWYTTRERSYSEVLPWDHLDAGLDREWLWSDWQDALNARELDDCRWTPCFDCGVCSNLGTDIQVGPTGRSLLPLVPR